MLSPIVTITPDQCGFVKGCCTSDAINAVRILLERHREKNLSVHTSFLDLEKAIDRVPHDLIWHALRSHAVPETKVHCVKLLCSRVTSVVRSPVGFSPPFNSVGVHQGSALSSLLFIPCMNTATADIQQALCRRLFLASTSRKTLQQQTQTWNDRLEDCGLKVNPKKKRISAVRHPNRWNHQHRRHGSEEGMRARIKAT